MIPQNCLKINLYLVLFECRGHGGDSLQKTKHISIRIDVDVLEKFHYVAKYEDRSASGQIMFLINNCIREFEKKHGEIPLMENEKK